MLREFLSTLYLYVHSRIWITLVYTHDRDSKAISFLLNILVFAVGMRSKRNGKQSEADSIAIARCHRDRCILVVGGLILGCKSHDRKRWEKQQFGTIILNIRRHRLQDRRYIQKTGNPAAMRCFSDGDRNRCASFEIFGCSLYRSIAHKLGLSGLQI